MKENEEKRRKKRKRKKKMNLRNPKAKDVVKLKRGGVR